MPSKKPKPKKASKEQSTTKLIEVCVELTVLQYQTVHVDTSQPGWKEQALRTAEQLAYVSGGEITDRRATIE